MPITQSRMIALITAASDYRNAFREACEMLRNAERTMESASMTPLQFLEWLREIAHHQLLKYPEQSASVIEAEFQHFRHVAKRNNAEMIRQRQRRIASGIAPQHTSHSDKPFGEFIQHEQFERSTAPESLLLQQPPHTTRSAQGIAPLRSRATSAAPRGRLIASLGVEDGEHSGGEHRASASTLSESRRARVLQEVEFEFAPEGHQGRWNSADSEAVACACGAVFSGFAQWSEHCGAERSESAAQSRTLSDEELDALEERALAQGGASVGALRESSAEPESDD
jgi:hypothetical protein